MKRWRITFTDSTTNEVLGDRDIWTGKSDVSLVTDIGDESPLPSVPSQTEGRDLTWGEFLDVAMWTDATKTNTILVSMPVVAEFGRPFTNVAEIKFDDAGTPGTRLAKLMTAAKQAGIINDDFIETFLANWIFMHPKMVPVP